MCVIDTHTLSSSMVYVQLYEGMYVRMFLPMMAEMGSALSIHSIKPYRNKKKREEE